MTKEEFFENNFEAIRHTHGCEALHCSICYYFINNPENLENESCYDFKKDFNTFLRRKKLKKLLYQ